jgi:hypothetical protein
MNILIPIVTIIVTLVIIKLNESSNSSGPPDPPKPDPPPSGQIVPIKPDPQPEPSEQTISITFIYDNSKNPDNKTYNVFNDTSHYIKFIVVKTQSQPNQIIIQDSKISCIDGSSVTLNIPLNGGVFIISGTCDTWTHSWKHSWNISRISNALYYDYATIIKLLSFSPIPVSLIYTDNLFDITPYTLSDNGGSDHNFLNDINSNFLPIMKNYYYSNTNAFQNVKQSVYGIDTLLNTTFDFSIFSLAKTDKYVQIDIYVQKIKNNIDRTQSYLPYQDPVIKVIHNLTQQTISPGYNIENNTILYQSYYFPDSIYSIPFVPNDGNFPYKVTLFIPQTGGVIISSSGVYADKNTVNYYPYSQFMSGDIKSYNLDFIYNDANKKLYNYLTLKTN